MFRVGLGAFNGSSNGYWGGTTLPATAGGHNAVAFRAVDPAVSFDRACSRVRHAAGMGQTKDPHPARILGKLEYLGTLVEGTLSGR